MTDKIKLKPCPFCGAEVEVVITHAQAEER